MLEGASVVLLPTPPPLPPPHPAVSGNRRCGLGRSQWQASVAAARAPAATAGGISSLGNSL